MNNIFVRIYGGLLAAFLLVSLFSLLVVKEIADYRTELYHKGISLGAIQLVAKGVARLEGEEREEWLQIVNRLLGEQIYWVQDPSAELGLGRIDFEILQQKKALVDFVKKGESSATEIYVQLPGEDKGYLFARLYEITEQQARGLAHLVLQELGPFDAEAWQTSMAQIQSLFNFPITRQVISELNVDKAQRTRLARGEVVVAFEDNVGDNTSIKIIAPVPEVREFLVLGPVKLFDWFPANFFVVGGLLALGVMALALYLLVRPLQQRLRRMEDAVTQIRRGDLKARVQVDSTDALGRLGKTFNGMAEHIQRLIQSQREMTHAVSHELRTPVARIRFGLEMIEDAVNDQQRVDQIRGIDADIEELNTLIDEILTYAQLEEGTPSLNFQRVDIDAILKQVKKESEALGSNIYVDYVPSQLPAEERYAECEERYIHRIVQNLVGNALRYANSIVRISSTVEGGMYRMEVEDDGAGIPPDQWEKVFIPFARLDDSRTRSSGGYGLGLSIVQRIAYWHGGVASVNKSPDLGGARFTIIWPQTQSIREKLLEKQVVNR